jgi:hypothetical protein
MATPSHLQREQALASLDPAIRLTKIQTLVTIRDVIRRIILPSARSRRSDGYVVQVGVDHALKTYTFVRPHMDLKGYCDSAKGEFDLVKLLSSANVVAFNQRMDIRLQESVYYTGPGKAWLIRELSHEEYVESDMYKETVARMTADPTQYVSICAPLMNVIDKKVRIVFYFFIFYFLFFYFLFFLFFFIFFLFFFIFICCVHDVTFFYVVFLFNLPNPPPPSLSHPPAHPVGLCRLCLVGAG